MGMPFLNDIEIVVIDQFLAALTYKLADQLHGVVLYGSKARGDFTPESDIDLLVIVDDDDWVIGNLISDIASDLSVEHDVLLLPHVVSFERWQKMAAAPFSFFRKLFRDGCPIYGQAAVFEPLERKQSPLLAEAIAALE